MAGSSKRASKAPADEHISRAGLPRFRRNSLPFAGVGAITKMVPFVVMCVVMCIVPVHVRCTVLFNVRFMFELIMIDVSRVPSGGSCGPRDRRPNISIGLSTIPPVDCARHVSRWHSCGLGYANGHAR